MKRAIFVKANFENWNSNQRHDNRYSIFDYNLIKSSGKLDKLTLKLRKEREKEREKKRTREKKNERKREKKRKKTK